MTRFQKVFLRDPLHGRVILAGFGKHPAWDDHIDDIGLETESLVIAKRVIYSEGIASQISSGAWNQLENSRCAMDFDHRFVWGRSDQSIVGGSPSPEEYRMRMIRDNVLGWQRPPIRFTQIPIIRLVSW